MGYTNQQRISASGLGDPGNNGNMSSGREIILAVSEILNQVSFEKLHEVLDL